ncbi:hypothetical protein Mal15_22480 [Stieleria maiorica]|uniref:Uncharacterized protein n=1 Tax=Stieleria maiorica TaxID=2795974 RepID=A0A5B9MCF7_9BACT|nr:hypothetical protein Mal15_22480 [Stieleria maiorica]
MQEGFSLRSRILGWRSEGIEKAHGWQREPTDGMRSGIRGFALPSVGFDLLWFRAAGKNNGNR